MLELDAGLVHGSVMFVLGSDWLLGDRTPDPSRALLPFQVSNWINYNKTANIFIGSTDVDSFWGLGSDVTTMEAGWKVRENAGKTETQKTANESDSERERDTRTHTHTHTQRGREREGVRSTNTYKRRTPREGGGHHFSVDERVEKQQTSKS